MKDSVFLVLLSNVNVFPFFFLIIPNLGQGAPPSVSFGLEKIGWLSGEAIIS